MLKWLFQDVKNNSNLSKLTVIRNIVVCIIIVSVFLYLLGYEFGKFLYYWQHTL
jgi:hypothetical protein